MSNTTARHRLALLAGSALMAVAFMPSAALAANECGTGTTVNCPAGTYSGGITYNVGSNFTLTTGPGIVNAGSPGIEVTATGSAGISFAPSGNVTGAGGADFVTASGDISIVLEAAGVLSGLRAISTSGDILIERIGNSNSGGRIVATSSGDITIRSGDEWGTLPEHNRGAGITVNSSSGSGAIYILNRNGENGQRSVIDGGLDATIGSGGMSLDIQGIGPEEGGFTTLPNPSSYSGEFGVSGGIVLRGSGAAEINIWRDGFFYIPPNFGTGGEVNLDREYAYMRGAFNASALAGGVTINVDQGGSWIVESNPVLSPVADTVRIGDGGFLTLPVATSSGEMQTIDFGGGDDGLTLEEGAHLLVGASNGSSGALQAFDTYEAQLRLTNLETFVNDGEIWMGTSVLTDGTVAGIFPEGMIKRQGTDRTADDILSMPGATFIGGPNSRIRLDADLNAVGSPQNRCDGALRDSGGSMPVADCIDLRNGAMEGTVLISVTPTSQGGRGAYNPEGNVIIDMSDGAGGPGSGAGLSPDAVVGFAPESRFYNEASGGILDNGMFSYHLFYDAEAMQVKLVGVPSAGAFHQTLIANAAQSAWRTANASFFDRQADLRDTLRRSEIGDHGVWLRVSYDDAERTVQQTFSIPAGDITYDNTHDVITTAVTMGVDFVRGENARGHWTAGGLLGYVRTDMEYARFWTDTAKINGMLAGVYGSYVNGPLYVDAVASGVWAGVVQAMPQAELFRDRDLSNDTETLGARLEAGWSFDFGAFRLDPLAHLAWSRTQLQDFKVPEDDPALPGNDVMFEETISTRAGLGLRGAADFEVMPGLGLGVSLTARYSQELDGESTAAIGNLNSVSPEVIDQFDGAFTEIVGGLTLASDDGRISGVLNVGPKFGDDYEALTASAGFRYQW